ncbi:hypothetical protein ACFQU7_17940 [Pseudoroseomonas wenyumeiae]
MTQLSLSDLSEKMRDIDIAMLSTHAEDGSIASRPMSNNGQVEYQGDSITSPWRTPTRWARSAATRRCR